ncbi:murein biosynthesis integral membrane protein MurJ [Candidatus Peregrinibacteria bacterium CG11_big_fil_rev_8_21_14_0_20_46_8]|nr:MAG: murein biosynthesis integral membrane protein MurJ [Candidatus Peregrinibacteria bacterium CG11_big_fil_rev_8_21_14_0_20_46_8]
MKRSTLLLGFSFLLSKILGLVRDNMLAAQFGALGGSGIFNLDIYYAAFRLPDLIFNLLAYGVLSAGFVPLFVEIMKKDGQKRAFAFANDILHITLLIMGTLSLAFFVFAPWIMPAFVPGFSEEALRITVQITRLMLITPILFTIGNIASGINNSLNRFWPLALAPVSYNAGIILGIYFLAPQYGVFGVAIGVLAGAALHTLVQIPSIVQARYRYTFSKKIWTPKVREMIFISLPRIFGMSVQQIALIISTIIASTLAIGSLTIFNFAINIASLPVGLIGISTAIASFSALSKYAADRDTIKFAAEVRQGITSILLLLIPMALGLFIVREEVVTLLLSRGKFGPADIVLTSNTLAFLIFGLLFEGVIFLLARGFYALKNTRIPVAAGVIGVSLHLIGSYILTQVWTYGTAGLALAQSVAHIVNAGILLILLQRNIGKSIIDWSELSKFALSGAIMALTVFAVHDFANEIFSDLGKLSVLPILALTIPAGMLVYFALLKILRAKTKAWSHELR